MLFQDENGEGVMHVPDSQPLEVMNLIRAGSDDQIRGMFARILRDAKIPAARAAEILRIKRTQYFEDLKRPFPGINDTPAPTQRKKTRTEVALPVAEV